MPNEKTVNIKLTREELCDLLYACYALNCEATTIKWERLFDKLEAQLSIFDKAIETPNILSRNAHEVPVMKWFEGKEK